MGKARTASKPRGNPNWTAGGPSPNPSGRGKTAERAANRTDGWANILTGFNTGRDKRRGASVCVEPLTDMEQRNLWRADDMAARAIETVPNEMFREGFEIKIADTDLLEALKPELKRLRFSARYKKAKQFERAYGGAAIFPVINDGSGDLSQPLDMKRITRIKNMRVLEPRELRAASYDDDINSDTFGEPVTYWYTPAHAKTSTIQIHRSRLIIFPGHRVTNDPYETFPHFGWGDSILTSMHEVLRDFAIGWNTAALLLVDFAQGVYSMDGLMEMIAAGKDGLVVKRLQTMDAAKSVIKAIVIDAKDKYERQQTPISGLPETLDRFASRLGAAARLPITILMGQSPKGLGNEGDSDVRFLYDQVSSEQDDTLPLVEQGLRLMMLQKDGPTKGKEPDTWCVEFCPLWQPSEKESAEARKLTAETDAIYLERGVIHQTEVRNARFGGESYSADLRVERESEEMGVDPAVAEQMKGDLRSTLAGGDPANQNQPEAEKPADTAMNGGQITSLLEVIMTFNEKKISKAAATAVLVRAFGVPKSEANDMLDESFEMPKPDPIMLGGAQQPGQPPAAPGKPAAPPLAKPTAPAAPAKPDPVKEEK